MEILKLTSPLPEKLNRLRRPIETLSYSGVDPRSLLNRPIVAIVGTRKPTPYGKRITEQYSTTLARAGVIIISGLAFGIDSIAHKAALSVQGSTIAVLPSGLKCIYPSSHAHLANDIRGSGCLLSEYDSHHKPRKKEFLERNRIIAACSDAVLIPEAAEQSGSLNTAMHAMRMHIPLFAVPGPLDSLMSSGTNRLLKSGRAQLTTTAQDILDLLALDKQKTKTPLQGLTGTEQKIIRALQAGLTEGPAIQHACELNTTAFQSTMTMLEIKGIVTQDTAARWYIT